MRNCWPFVREEAIDLVFEMNSDDNIEMLEVNIRSATDGGTPKDEVVVAGRPENVRAPEVFTLSVFTSGRLK